MLSVVVAALDVSLDIFSTGRRAFRFTTTRKCRLFYGVHELTQLYSIASPFYTLKRGGGGTPEIRRNNNNTLAHTNTKNTDGFPRHDTTVERG